VTISERIEGADGSSGYWRGSAGPHSGWSRPNENGCGRYSRLYRAGHGALARPFYAKLPKVFLISGSERHVVVESDLGSSQ
jgi:hypothetical protein